MCETQRALGGTARRNEASRPLYSTQAKPAPRPAPRPVVETPPSVKPPAGDIIDVEYLEVHPTPAPATLPDHRVAAPLLEVKEEVKVEVAAAVAPAPQPKEAAPENTDPLKAFLARHSGLQVQGNPDHHLERDRVTKELCAKLGISYVDKRYHKLKVERKRIWREIHHRLVERYGKSVTSLLPSFIQDYPEEVFAAPAPAPAPRPAPQPVVRSTPIPASAPTTRPFTTPAAPAAPSARPSSSPDNLNQASLDAHLNAAPRRENYGDQLQAFFAQRDQWVVVLAKLLKVSLEADKLKYPAYRKEVYPKLATALRAAGKRVPAFLQ